MPEHMPEHMPEDMPDYLPEDMPEHLPEDMPGRMPEDMPDRMPDRMPENMSDRMPEDLPVTKCINVMVGITRSKVIHFLRDLVVLASILRLNLRSTTESSCTKHTLQIPRTHNNCGLGQCGGWSSCDANSFSNWKIH